MNTKKKRYVYTYYGTPITGKRFKQNVPENWEKEYDKIKGYSFGGYDAVLIEE